MKKKLVALLLVAVMTIAASVIPASAANYDNLDFSAVKGSYWYVNSYDNIVVCVQGEDGDPGILGADHVGDCYGIILFCTADSTANINLVVNAENNGWTNGYPTSDSVAPVAYADGVYYTNYYAESSPFVSGESYSQYCPCNWSGSPATILGYALLDKDGNYLYTEGTCPATSPVAAAATTTATLPQTGVVSAAVIYAVGAALIGGGVIVTKKSRKED